MRFSQHKSTSSLTVMMLILTAFLLTTLAVPDYGTAGAHRYGSRKHHNKGSRKKVWKKRSHRKSDDHIDVRGLYCVNLRNNEVIWDYCPDRRLPIASLTKLVTALVTLEHVPLEKKIRLPRRLPMVPKSIVHLRPGDVVTTWDLLHGLLMASGNDCAEALAYAFPEGRREFIAEMNRKARALGVRHTVFYTPSGLDKRIVRRNSKGKRIVRIKSNVSTAREMAKIARVAFADDTIRSICRKKTYIMASRKLKWGYLIKNTNRLLREGLPLVGGKTGYTRRAKRCLATEFRTKSGPILIVVLGSENHFHDTKIVYRKALRIMAEDRYEEYGRADRDEEEEYSYGQGG